MAPPRTVVTTSSCSLLLIYQPRQDERLSWPSWLTYSGQFTHIIGHPSAVGRAQDSESSPVKDQRSTAEPRDTMRDRVYQMLHRDVAHLRQCLIDTWNGLSQSISDDAVDG